jgi:CBS domain-containing protein
MKKARDVMTENPASCRPQDSIYDAVKLMEVNNCGVIPIVDEMNRCVGIVTDRDICLYIGLSESAIEPKNIPVSEVMSEGPITCNPEESLQTVVRMMEENQVRRIPVVDAQGILVGIIAQADIALGDENRQEVSNMVTEISK